MKSGLFFFFLSFFLFFGSTELKCEDITTKRQKAMDILYQSRTLLFAGDFRKGLAKCEEALRLDPGLALAHLVRGHFAFNQGEDEKALKHLERGLQLLHEEGQPINFRQDNSVIQVDASEIKGDHKVILGAVYVALAEKSSRQKNARSEQMFLEKAHKTLTEALQEKPNPELRELANNLLRAFRKTPYAP